MSVEVGLRRPEQNNRVDEDDPGRAADLTLDAEVCPVPLTANFPLYITRCQLYSGSFP